MSEDEKTPLPEADLTDAPEERTAIHGIVVQRIDHEDGNFSTALSLIGDCRKTEVTTLLRQALKVAERDLGE